MIAVRVGNSFHAEVGAGDGLRAGAGLRSYTASSILFKQSDQGKLTFAAGFVVVHLRKTFNGKGLTKGRQIHIFALKVTKIVNKISSAIFTPHFDEKQGLYAILIGGTKSISPLNSYIALPTLE
jgi:hypothetical protein